MKKLFFFLSVSFSVLLFPVLLHAQSIAENLTTLEMKLMNLKNQINGLKSYTKELKNRIESLETTLTDYEKLLSALNQELMIASQRLTELSITYDDLENQLKEQKSINNFLTIGVVVIGSVFAVREIGRAFQWW